MTRPHWSIVVAVAAAAFLAGAARARRVEDQNLRPVDQWTAVHLATGVVFGKLETPFVAAIVLAAAYEILEQIVERGSLGERLFGASRPESAANVVIDLMVFALGYAIGKALRQ